MFKRLLSKKKLPKLYIVLTVIGLLVAAFLVYRIYFTRTDVLIDEKGNKIDINTVEKEEQDQANEYILPTDCVLELGARYGSVSVIINKKLDNPKLHVVVEPDEEVWDALETNKKNRESQFHIVKGFISNKKLGLNKGGYGSNQFEDEKSTIPNVSMEQVTALVGTPFTALVADCEGCIEMFLNENPSLLKTLRLILLEEDFTDKCNYDNVKRMLRENNFKEIKPGFHCVWVRE
jgi:hypothetical protein